MKEALVEREVIYVRPRETAMGRLYAQLKLSNFNDPSQTMTVSALVHTGAGYITLPMAWRDRLGELRQIEVLATMADGSAQKAWLCAGVEAQIGNFRPIFAEVLFLDMQPNQDGEYEPLIGYIALEQAGAAVDMLGHRLLHVPYVDAK